MVAGWLGRKSTNDLQWRNVYSKEGGKYRMTLAYVSGESRSLVLEVNGKRVKSVSLNSGNWDTFKTYTFDIELNAGDNVVRLYNSSNWMPSIDYMSLRRVPDVNGIKDVKTGKSSRKNAVLLDGRRATKEKGVVIVDGKKVLK